MQAAEAVVAGGIVDLGTLVGKTSRAYGINNHGQVVGTSATASGAEHASLWQDGKMTDLGTLGGDRSFAYGINDCGQVVGEARTASDTSHAALWPGKTD
jgi:probable HAF family extracellular repeat protein